MVVDPTYVEEHWVRGSEAAATAIAYGPALDAKELGEGLSADGHDVEWINPIQFLATSKERRDDRGIALPRCGALDPATPSSRHRTWRSIGRSGATRGDLTEDSEREN